jgi:hypothetical protein
MRELRVYFIDIGPERLFVSKEDYQKIEKGKPVTVRRGFRSNLLLGIQQ